MKKIKVKQGTRLWEELKENRIGSSEVFDIVRYYATESELINCGLDPEKFKNELPFVSTWALYHKILNDGVYKKPLLDPALGEYGLAMEQYGLKVLQEGRELRLRKGDVYISDRLIASLDIGGISELCDKKVFDYGSGTIDIGKKFVCEQKTISPYKDYLPLKYVIQAQYQITMSHSDFFILQAMILNDDTPFERGKIVALANSSKKKFFEYVKDRVVVQHLYFENNEALARLIKVCLNRFFKDVDNRKEPKPYLEMDSATNILTSIRNNSFYNSELTKEFDLSEYVKAKEDYDLAEENKRKALQKIIDFAMANNCSKFVCPQYFGSFSSNGRFLLKERANDNT